MLFASHGVVASTLAVAFSALFSLGVLLVGPRYIAGWPWALVVGAAMLLAAVLLRVGARRRFRELSARRTELEQALARQEGAR